MSDLFRNTLNFLRSRRRAYKLAFGSPAGQAVLIDLASFCRARESCVVPGSHDKTLVLEGRREVWLRIADHFNFSEDQLYAIYSGNGFTPTTPQDKDL